MSKVWLPEEPVLLSGAPSNHTVTCGQRRLGNVPRYGPRWMSTRRQSRQQNTLRKQPSLRWSSLLKRTPAHSRKSGQTGESRARGNSSN
jgi:hypothetical protein